MYDAEMEIAASEFGRLGAIARAEALTPEQRSNIASIAANTRWKGSDKSKWASMLGKRGGRPRKKPKIDKSESIPCFMTDEEYEEMKYNQGDVCFYCRKPNVDKKGNYCKLCKEHDHKTGKIRSLTCNGCNSMLGFAKDNPEVLRAAALHLEYLENQKRASI